jgi:phosphatidylglycerophosphate synthase
MKETIVNYVRAGMTKLAIVINRATKGKLKPSHVTLISLLGHIPVAWALINCRPVLAAILLAFFSILDALDGALARVQKTSSLTGMYFDAVSDRVKELIVYTGLAVYASKHIAINISWVIVAVAGSSLLVSYTKAKGEMALARKVKDPQELNRIFGRGIASYEVRVVLLVIGLLLGWLVYILPFLLILNLLTIGSRFINVTRALNSLDKE